MRAIVRTGNGRPHYYTVQVATAEERAYCSLGERCEMTVEWSAESSRSASSSSSSASTCVASDAELCRRWPPRASSQQSKKRPSEKCIVLQSNRLAGYLWVVLAQDGHLCLYARRQHLEQCL